MRSILFIVCYVAFSYTPNVLANSLSSSFIQNKGPTTSAGQRLLPAWAGFHTGLILGGQWGRSSDKTGDFGYNADHDQWHYNESGLHAGGALGYGYSWRHLVIGPEIELGYLDLGGNGAQPDSPGFDTVGKSSGDLYTAFRARLGMARQEYLLFASGGLMGVRETMEVVDSCNIAPCGGGMVNAQKNRFVWGYTLGAGIEHWVKNDWSVKFEYLYFDLSNQNFSGTTNLGTMYLWTGKTLGHILRGGLNYHF